jgi:hypothetical protein
MDIYGLNMLLMHQSINQSINQTNNVAADRKLIMILRHQYETIMGGASTRVHGSALIKHYFMVML